MSILPKTKPTPYGLMDPNYIYIEVVQFYPSKRAYLDNAANVRSRMALLMGIPYMEPCIVPPLPRTWYYFHVQIKPDSAKHHHMQNRTILELNRKNAAYVDYMYAAVADIYTNVQRLPVYSCPTI